jgi:hypothetical protein
VRLIRSLRPELKSAPPHPSRRTSHFCNTGEDAVVGFLSGRSSSSFDPRHRQDRPGALVYLYHKSAYTEMERDASGR